MARKKSRTSVKTWRIGTGLVSLFLFSFVGFYAGLPSLGKDSFVNPLSGPGTTTPVVFLGRQATHVSTPSSVKGIYMTACTASVKSLRSSLVKLIDDTELNSVVIDIKTFDGYLSFTPESNDLKVFLGGCRVSDMQDFIDTLHEHGIYVIGRIASFQDQLQVKLHPALAVKKATATSTVWKDYKGISWIDASAKTHWTYLVEIAKEAHSIGFDEINFDYIRFPADGDMKDIYYPLSGTRKKSDVMREFYDFLHAELSPKGIIISADLFGMTTTNEDDLNIGQILENALPNFDYIAPMVYPSHYPNGFIGLDDPNKHVYEVVRYSMDKAVERTVATSTKIALPNARIGTSTPALYAKPSFDPKKMRPWLQDNNYPVTYTADMVRKQIQAAYDSGLDSWMLWSASNKYTRDALLTGGE